VTGVESYFLANHYITFYMVIVNPYNVFDIHQRMKCTSIYWNANFYLTVHMFTNAGYAKRFF